MIIKSSDIVKKQGTLLINTLGGLVITGFGKISMHEPTGVVFIEQKVNNNFQKFIVGVISAQSLITEEREFDLNNEENFFDAVKYFEELIEKLSPPEEQDLPSIGKFYFFKESLRKECYVVIPGLPNVIIQRMDIPLVFTPPQKKPYGRLNLTDIKKPEYEQISSKYALKYNEEESKEDTDYQAGFYSLSDFAVYDMTPYDNKESQPGEEQPEDVNDEKLSPQDIEGEDMDDKKNKEKERKEQKEKRDKGDKGDNGDKGDKGDKGDEITEVNKGDEQEDLTDKKNKQLTEDKGDFKEFDFKENEKIKKLTEKSLIPLLEKQFDAISGLKNKFRKQSFLISSLNSYSNQQLKELFYDKLNLPGNFQKADFIKLVSDNTKTIF